MIEESELHAQCLGLLEELRSSGERFGSSELVLARQGYNRAALLLFYAGVEDVRVLDGPLGA